MQVTVVSGGDPRAATLLLPGELDLATAAGFEAKVGKLLLAGTDRLVTDPPGPGRPRGLRSGWLVTHR